MLLPPVTGRNEPFLMYMGKRDTPQLAVIAEAYHAMQKAADRE
jgi:hypothetical protein